MRKYGDQIDLQLRLGCDGRTYLKVYNVVSIADHYIAGFIRLDH
jgi:hypothetical protein